jgi:MFS family permease
LFYYVASPTQPWWIIGAWTLWVAYAGLNVCLPNLMIKLAPAENTSPYISVYYAIKGVFYGLSTVFGGWLFGVLQQHPLAFTPWPFVSDHYDLIFLVGFVLRTTAIVFLLRIIEPDACDLEEIISTRRSHDGGENNDIRNTATSK